ncbi:MAG: hypothetical protein ACKVP4_01580 [Hyphomicrobium sp.]
MFLSTAIVARTLIAAAALVTISGSASAVSFRVKLACASDYYSYCSQHSPDTPGVRQCMRANGPKLSKSCINALIGAGEVAKSEVDRRRAAAKTAAK